MSLVIKIRAILRVLFSLGLMFAILFKSAGRWDYWHGWVYFLLWTYLVLFNWLIIPSELVQERIQPGVSATKWDYIYFFLMFVPLSYLIPLVAALDGGRYHWTGDFPLLVNVLAFIIIFLGGSLEIVSLWTNKFFSAIIRIQKERGHYVIDKGPYAFIRHPGYAGGTLSYVCTPFALNSLWALIPAGIFLIGAIIRTYLEDITLQNELPGYRGYSARVRYRALVKQYKKLFRMEGLELHFEEAAIKAVVQQAIERGTGARALRSIIEEVMLDIMYNLPQREGVATCTITKDVILKGKDPLYTYVERKQTA